VRAVVCGLPAELSPRRRTHARTWGVGGHATVNRWVLKYAPQSEEAFHLRKRPVLVSCRLDETSIRITGQWPYLYRAVDKTGQTIDLLLAVQRDQNAALRFLKKAIRRHGVPEMMTIDGSEANAIAIGATTKNMARQSQSAGSDISTISRSRIIAP